MAKALCNLDEKRLLDFMARAAGIIPSSGFETPTLSLLEFAPALKNNPQLAELAKEFLAPFESETCGGEPFASLKEALLTMFCADPEGNVPFRFRTFASNETEYWDLSGTPLIKYVPFPIFGLFLIREGDRFRYGDFLENIFCYPTLPDDAPKNKYGQDEIEAFFDTNQGAEMLHQGDGCEYLPLPDVARMDDDPRLSRALVFTADLLSDLDLRRLDPLPLSSRDPFGRAVQDCMEIIMDQLAEEATEQAREYFQGNAAHPRVVLAA